MHVFIDVKPEDHENFLAALDKIGAVVSSEEIQKLKKSERNKKDYQNRKLKNAENAESATKESTKENIYILNNNQEELNINNTSEELKEKEKIKNKKEKENAKKKFGQFRNVLLTDEELLNFQEKFPDTWKSKIEEMSIAIASKGYVYKSHYAALLNWARKNGDYTFESRKGERAFKEAQQQKLTPSEIGRMLDELDGIANENMEQVVDL